MEVPSYFGTNEVSFLEVPSHHNNAFHREYYGLLKAMVIDVDLWLSSGSEPRQRHLTLAAFFLSLP